MESGIESLTREQMFNAVGRLGGDIPRVPLGWAKFYNRETIAKYGQDLSDLSDTIVDDYISLRYLAPGNTEAPEGTRQDYRWAIEEGRGDLADQGYTSRLVVSSTDLIDSFIEQMPGTAPGLTCPLGDKVIYAVPGVPHEMRDMVSGSILPDLQRRMGVTAVIRSRVLRSWGESESGLAEMLHDRIEALEEAGNPTLAFQAPCAGGELGHGDAAGLIDEQRQVLKLL